MGALGTAPLDEAADPLAELGPHFVRGAAPRTEPPRLATL